MGSAVSSFVWGRELKLVGFIWFPELQMEDAKNGPTQIGEWIHPPLKTAFFWVYKGSMKQQIIVL